jgi:hypothetical protein
MLNRDITPVLRNILITNIDSVGGRYKKCVGYKSVMIGTVNIRIIAKFPYFLYLRIYSFIIADPSK